MNEVKRLAITVMFLYAPPSLIVFRSLATKVCSLCKCASFQPVVTVLMLGVSTQADCKELGKKSKRCKAERATTLQTHDRY